MPRGFRNVLNEHDSRRLEVKDLPIIMTRPRQNGMHSLSPCVSHSSPYCVFKEHLFKFPYGCLT